MGTKILLCDCAGTQVLDPDRIESACGVSCSKVHTALCTTQLQSAVELMQEGATTIACLQEQEMFQSLAEDLNIEMPGFFDLRDRAGWSDQGADATPKMAALAAEAQLPQPVTPSVDVVSEGTCFIVGPGAVSFDVAERLAGTLAVTVLATDQAEPISRAFDVIRGQVKSVVRSAGRVFHFVWTRCNRFYRVGAVPSHGLTRKMGRNPRVTLSWTFRVARRLCRPRPSVKGICALIQKTRWLSNVWLLRPHSLLGHSKNPCTCVWKKPSAPIHGRNRWAVQTVWMFAQPVQSPQRVNM